MIIHSGRFMIPLVLSYNNCGPRLSDGAEPQRTAWNYLHFIVHDWYIIACWQVGNRELWIVLVSPR